MGFFTPPSPYTGQEEEWRGQVPDERIRSKYNYWITSHVCIVTCIGPVSEQKQNMSYSKSELNILVEIKTGKKLIYLQKLLFICIVQNI